MTWRIFALAGTCGWVSLLAACATTNNDQDIATHWMQEMDALPAEEQVPNWDNTRALMMRQAPRPGDPAPDFELQTRHGEGVIRLSEFQAARPVVLIFGSWT